MANSSIFFLVTDDLSGVEGEVFESGRLIDAIVEEADPPQIRRRHEPRVKIPIRGHIYKATLVSLLNQDPHLLHDRLVLNITQQNKGLAVNNLY